MPSFSRRQIVHHFRDEGLRDRSRQPDDHVVIFDEAQRAWNLRKTADFMKRRKKLPGFEQSEPEFLLSYMDRHGDWAVVVCLVGGGQEIHTGEAGIAASMRSFCAEALSGFVKTALDGECGAARALLSSFRDRYPVVITRDLARAKTWIRSHARGSERYGLVASSQAERLKPHAIDVRVSIDPVKCFLNGAADTRASCFLEDAATEFQVQGLELDWTCVTWDADLRRTEAGWSHHAFRGDRWTQIRHPERKRYLVNAYRVLLTRARQGMAIFVPPGDRMDHTRRSDYYDGTFAYLAGLGIPVLE